MVNGFFRLTWKSIWVPVIRQSLAVTPSFPCLSAHSEHPPPAGSRSQHGERGTGREASAASSQLRKETIATPSPPCPRSRDVCRRPPLQAKATFDTVRWWRCRSREQPLRARAITCAPLREARPPQSPDPQRCHGPTTSSNISDDTSTNAARSTLRLRRWQAAPRAATRAS